MNLRLLAVCSALAVALSVPAAGQTGPPAPAQPAATSAPGADSYAYQPDGRRDPFVSLLGAGTDARDVGRRVEGPAGMPVAEISVRGVLESRGALIAIVQGLDNKTYVVHQGDKFLDGTIRSITPQGLVVVQDVHDPLSHVKHREVRKLLRSLEEAKE